nr:MAG TPA: hypothetical protein [Bacteriophage sp.]
MTNSLTIDIIRLYSKHHNISMHKITFLLHNIVNQVRI